MFELSQMAGYLESFLKKLKISQVPRHLRNFQNLKNMPPSNTCRNLGNFPNAWVSGNFPNAWVSGKFPKCMGICEISQVPRHLKNFQNLKNMPPLNTYRNLGKFPNAWVSGKLPKCLGIWETSQMPGYLGNFPNAWVSGKFPKCLGIWKISQLPRFLGNSPNIQ